MHLQYWHNKSKKNSKTSAGPLRIRWFKRVPPCALTCSNTPPANYPWLATISCHQQAFPLGQGRIRSQVRSTHSLVATDLSHSASLIPLIFYVSGFISDGLPTKNKRNCWEKPTQVPIGRHTKPCIQKLKYDISEKAPASIPGLLFRKLPYKTFHVVLLLHRHLLIHAYKFRRDGIQGCALYTAHQFSICTLYYKSRIILHSSDPAVGWCPSLITGCRTAIQAQFQAKMVVLVVKFLKWSTSQRLFSKNLVIIWPKTCKTFGFAMKLVKKNLKKCPKVKRKNNRFLSNLQVVVCKTKQKLWKLATFLQ